MFSLTHLKYKAGFIGKNCTSNSKEVKETSEENYNVVRTLINFIHGKVYFARSNLLQKKNRTNIYFRFLEDLLL